MTKSRVLITLAILAAVAVTGLLVFSSAQPRQDTGLENEPDPLKMVEAPSPQQAQVPVAATASTDSTPTNAQIVASADQTQQPLPAPNPPAQATPAGLKQTAFQRELATKAARGDWEDI